MTDTVTGTEVNLVQMTDTVTGTEVNLDQMTDSDMTGTEVNLDQMTDTEDMELLLMCVIYCILGDLAIP